MASERQIAANRLNAKTSTGPKSVSGKKRSSQNALRHGLAVPISRGASETQLEELSRQFPGNAADANSFALARRAAEAHLEFERVRRAQDLLIERAAMLGGDGVGSDVELEELRHHVAQIERRENSQKVDLPQSRFAYGSCPVPGGNKEKQRLANTVRPLFSELSKLGRYEKRAVGRRDRAIREIVSVKPAADSYGDNSA
jgi:hypothetical protein